MPIAIIMWNKHPGNKMFFNCVWFPADVKQLISESSAVFVKFDGTTVWPHNSRRQPYKADNETPNRFFSANKIKQSVITSQQQNLSCLQADGFQQKQQGEMLNSMTHVPAQASSDNSAGIQTMTRKDVG